MWPWQSTYYRVGRLVMSQWGKNKYGVYVGINVIRPGLFSLTAWPLTKMPVWPSIQINSIRHGFDLECASIPRGKQNLFRSCMKHCCQVCMIRSFFFLKSRLHMIIETNVVFISLLDDIQHPECTVVWFWTIAQNTGQSRTHSYDKTVVMQTFSCGGNIFFT